MYVLGRRPALLLQPGGREIWPTVYETVDQATAGVADFVRSYNQVASTALWATSGWPTSLRPLRNQTKASPDLLTIGGSLHALPRPIITIAEEPNLLRH